MKETLNRLFTFNNHRISIIIISLLGAWILCIPYEGQLLYTLVEGYGTESSELLNISLAMQVVGMILGGVFLKTLKAARKTIIYAIPVCILCTVTFFFPSYTIWLITLTLCSALAGICIASFGFLIKNYIIPANRFSVAAAIIMNTNILKMLINNISLYVSIQTGFAFTIIMLGAALYLTFKMPLIQDKRTVSEEFDKKTGIKALILLFLFVTVIAIDFGITVMTIDPKFESLGWVTNWYWILPCIGAAFFIKRLKSTDYRNGVLYISVGMMGIGFISFMILDHSVSSYLIVNTVMKAACTIGDMFWFSIIINMLVMVKSPSKIMSVGFGAVMIGVLLGKLIADSDLTKASLSIIPMAIICLTLFILPALHKLLSKMIKKNAIDNIAETNMIEFPDGIDMLTEREKQVAALVLKGRTCKLIADELYLSENTVKTHIKNIYSKLGVKRKSELFNFRMDKTIDS